MRAGRASRFTRPLLLVGSLYLLSRTGSGLRGKGIHKGTNKLWPANGGISVTPRFMQGLERGTKLDGNRAPDKLIAVVGSLYYGVTGSERSAREEDHRLVKPAVAFLALRVRVPHDLRPFHHDGVRALDTRALDLCDPEAGRRDVVFDLTATEAQERSLLAPDAELPRDQPEPLIKPLVEGAAPTAFGTFLTVSVEGVWHILVGQPEDRRQAGTQAVLRMALGNSG